MSSTTARPLRSDARLNHDRLLEAAARAFARDGVDASLKSIAKDAGVGIGTLYRRFPTRESLVEATYRSESARLAESASALLDVSPPVEALRIWMARFVEFMAAKHGMADSLRAVLLADASLGMTTKDTLTDALSALLAAGIADGTVRAEIETDDVLMSIGGISLIVGEPAKKEQAGRLLDLLVDGLKSRRS